MGYRVRSPDGELRFDHFADIVAAYRHGLVSPTDEIFEDGREGWMAAEKHALLRATGRKPQGRGQRLGIFPIMAVCVLGAGSIGIWHHSDWPIYVRAAAVIGMVIAMALTLTGSFHAPARRPGR